MWLDAGSVVDVVLFDFAKVFDMVDHEVLLFNLSCLVLGSLLFLVYVIFFLSLSLVLVKCLQMI